MKKITKSFFILFLLLLIIGIVGSGCLGNSNNSGSGSFVSNSFNNNDKNLTEVLFFAEENGAIYFEEGESVTIFYDIDKDTTPYSSEMLAVVHEFYDDNTAPIIRSTPVTWTSSHPNIVSFSNPSTSSTTIMTVQPIPTNVLVSVYFKDYDETLTFTINVGGQ